jgi:hypothetical protein
MHNNNYTVHILDGGVWFYIKSYRLNGKYYKCDTDEILDNTKIYNVIEN